MSTEAHGFGNSGYTYTRWIRLRNSDLDVSKDLAVQKFPEDLHTLNQVFELKELQLAKIELKAEIYTM